jgi:ubiquinone/menaquinone biosynthesis C-methylase UbiE
VLCLACGGDRKAAEHYGYEITTIHGDMRDLSMLDDESFDMVYGTAITYVPDAQEVYTQVDRVLRPGGLYHSDWYQPAIHFIGWDGTDTR